jgi:hypothetical protein
MSEIPSGSVVRGGGGEGGRGLGAEGRALRLAPRVVPRPLVRRLIFGGWLAAFGWAFAAGGMVVALVILPMLDLSFADYDRQASATMTSIEDAGWSENDRTVHRVRYTFVDESGVEHGGVSYTTDPPAGLEPWEVEYRSGTPSESRLHGMRRGPFPAFLLFLLAVPMLGLAAALWQVPGALRKLRLLRCGAETRGKLVRKRETRVEVNDVPIMALTFEYEVGGRTYFATVKTLTPGPLEDEAREAMLYDPRSPRRATTLDHLPGAPKIGAGGELEARPGTALHLLILPVLFVGLAAATVIRMI